MTTATTTTTTADPLATLMPTKALPPERIVVCIDLSAEMDRTWSFNGKKMSRLQSAARLAVLFMNSKRLLNGRCEFAVLLASTQAFWLCDFTPDVPSVQARLLQLCAEGDFASFDVSTIHRRIREKIVGDFVYRCVLVYGRSACVPVMTAAPDDLAALQRAPNFFLDVVFLHEKSDAKAQAVFDALLAAEAKDRNEMWAFEMTTPKGINMAFTRLLAHPYTRGAQHLFKSQLPPA